MPARSYAKARQRFVMYIPNSLREEVEDWAGKTGTTLAEFGRQAFESYLENNRREERKAQLAETCRLFENQNNHIVSDWAGAESEKWPV